jgi:beta-lactamase superfamily II metal-dependent hydrolase
MIRIEMLPAQYGDCLWVEYGQGASTHTLLIDGGVAATYDAVVARLGGLRTLELFCVTHIDEDHIQGALKLLANVPAGLAIGEVWFNGYDHVIPTRLGARQGEELSAAIVSRAKAPWNTSFGEQAVVVPDAGPLPVRTLPGGLALTLLSPRQSELDRLKPVWEKECKKAGIMPGDIEDAEAALAADKRMRLGDYINVQKLADDPYSADSAPANGSSIAFLAEYGGAAVLFGADAHSEVLVAGLKRLNQERGQNKVRLNACKLPHHGSKFNNSPEFIGLLDCPRWLFSTNGKRFGHPDPETISRILVSRRGKGTELFFNYRSDENRVWDDDALTGEWSYSARFPKLGREGIVVEV